MAAWKLAPALAAGNICVLKPAETTSITAVHLAEIFQETELPDGVVNIVTGAGATGRALIEHGDGNKRSADRHKASRIIRPESQARQRRLVVTSWAALPSTGANRTRVAPDPTNKRTIQPKLNGSSPADQRVVQRSGSRLGRLPDELMILDEFNVRLPGGRIGRPPGEDGLSLIGQSREL